MLRAVKTLKAMALTVLLAAFWVFWAPAPAALADAVAGAAVGVEYSSSPHDTNYRVHNGVAQNSLDPHSPYPLFVKHVGSTKHPLCAETLGFYSKSEPVPQKKKLKPDVDRGYTRWASVPYNGTPIVYLSKGDVHNAVFRKFIKKDGTELTLGATVLLSKDELKAGALYINHYNMVQGSFFFEQNAKRTEVIEIRLMKDIPQCAFKK